MSNDKSSKRTSKLSASQKVDDYIKQAVYRGQLQPRERIIEDELARRLGVSRGTVRESLLRLERDGLIVTTSRRGTFIRDLSYEETKVVFNMRGKLEGLCVRYMREAMKPETEAVLKKALRKMEEAAIANDDELFYYADMEIHHTIWRLSDQPLLIRTLNSVMNPFIFMIARSRSFRIPMAEKFENHKQYVDMILKLPLGRVEGEVERYFDKLYRNFVVSVFPGDQPTEGISWWGSPVLDQP